MTVFGTTFSRTLGDALVAAGWIARSPGGRWRHEATGLECSLGVWHRVELRHPTLDVPDRIESLRKDAVRAALEVAAKIHARVKSRIEATNGVNQ